MSKIYIIECKKEKNGVLTSVKGRTISETKEIVGFEHTKDDVIKNIIDKGYLYYVQKSDATLIGVHTVKRDYIRTDKDQTTKDNLDFIDECKL